MRKQEVGAPNRFHRSVRRSRALVIAAPASGSGKTIVTLSLLRAMKQAGHRVSSAKIGPDYIDPRFHEAATAADCWNIDPWAMSRERIRSHLSHLGEGADLVIVEGVMGLFDGAASGTGSTADFALEHDLPVVLVVNCSHQAQSIAALVKGFRDHREGLRLAGVILNQVASDRHDKLLRMALEKEAIPVLGSVFRNAELALPSRHLGLVQASENRQLDSFLNTAAKLVADTCDLEAVIKASGPLNVPQTFTPPLPPLGQRVAVAQDQAFAFCYPHHLHGWRTLGAEILPFSPLAGDAPSPDVDAIFLPGGYPELHAAKISANSRFMTALAKAADSGIPVYGECGGYMVLGDALMDADGNAHKMAGLLPITTTFAKRRLSLGYRKLTHKSPLPWPSKLMAHEFHYSTIERRAHAESLFEASDSEGKQLPAMGMRRGSVMGSYAHVIDQAA